MSVNVSVTPDANQMIAKLGKAFSAALLSIPPFPSGTPVVTSNIGGNIFAGELDLPLAPSPALELWFAEVTAKLEKDELVYTYRVLQHSWPHIAKHLGLTVSGARRAYERHLGRMDPVFEPIPAVVPGLPTAGAPVSPYRPPLPTESP